ncbi:formylglycine-generating enzyme family protein [Bacteroidota bacterium]
MVEYEATGINPEQLFTISLSYSTDGIKWVEAQKGLSGSIGKGQQLKSSNQIIWEPLQELSFFTSSSIQFKVIANQEFTLEFVLNKIQNDMVSIPKGTFMMGCAFNDKTCEENEKPRHKVTLEGFLINKFEVTQIQWELIMGTTIHEQRNKANPTFELYGIGPDFPIYYVSWEEAQDFIKKLNQLTGRKFRLPTEEEWEYAARGGNPNYLFSGSNELSSVGWFDGNSKGQTHPVGEKSANGFGLFDMTGNVWEWCSNVYSPYKQIPNSLGLIFTSNSIVGRGGAWNKEKSKCRLSKRGRGLSHYRRNNLGFRIVE